MAKSRILIVDDEATNLKLLGEILRDKNELTFAKSGEEALQRLADQIPDLVLMDIMMPGMDGYEVAKKIFTRPETQHLPLIFVSAMTEEQDEVKGIELGAVDYIAKPINPAIVKARVETHLKVARMQRQLEETNRILDEKVAQRTDALQSTVKEIIYRLVRAAEYRDPETGNHIKRLSFSVDILSRHYGLRAPECEVLRTASLMHDIGKVGTPDHVLLKEGKLSKEEWEIMKLHTVIGDEILDGSRFDIIHIGKSIAACHHERWDGTGYPKGLAGEKIPLEARLTAVADVFDALLSKRPYKEPWTPEAAAEYIVEQKGYQFDPKVVEAFQKAFTELVELRQKYPD